MIRRTDRSCPPISAGVEGSRTTHGRELTVAIERDSRITPPCAQARFPSNEYSRRVVCVSNRQQVLLSIWRRRQPGRVSRQGSRHRSPAAAESSSQCQQQYRDFAARTSVRSLCPAQVDHRHTCTTHRTSSRYL